MLHKKAEQVAIASASAATGQSRPHQHRRAWFDACTDAHARAAAPRLRASAPPRSRAWARASTGRASIEINDDGGDRHQFLAVRSSASEHRASPQMGHHSDGSSPVVILNHGYYLRQAADYLAPDRPPMLASDVLNLYRAGQIDAMPEAQPGQLGHSNTAKARSSS